MRVRTIMDGESQPTFVDGWWGGDQVRRLVYGTPLGRANLEDVLGEDYHCRASFSVDVQHVVDRHFRPDIYMGKSKFAISFAQASQSCGSVLRAPNRVRFCSGGGVLFSGAFDIELGVGLTILKVRVHLDGTGSPPVKTFYPDCTL